MAKTKQAKKAAKPAAKKAPVKEKKALAKVQHIQDPQQVAEYRAKEKIKSWLQATGKVRELQQGELDQFLEIASAYQLNPFKREIHVVVRSKDDPSKRALQITIGYEVYIKRAERLRILDGWKCWTEGKDQDLIAKIQIMRKDQKHPFEWEVKYREAVQDSPIWKKMPAFMLKKVCISQGFRLCFPDELGGMPYIDEEIPDDSPVSVQSEQAKPEEIYAKAEVIEETTGKGPDDPIVDNVTALREAVGALNHISNNSIKPAFSAIMQKIKTSTKRLMKFAELMKQNPSKVSSVEEIENILMAMEE